jgi:hypothetical protein
MTMEMKKTSPFPRFDAGSSILMTNGTRLANVKGEIRLASAKGEKLAILLEIGE